MIHIRHSAAFCFLLNSVASSTLGTYEQYIATLGCNIANSIDCIAIHRQGLFEVKNMDFVAGSENVLRHFWIPESGLMTKMHASFQHLTH